MTLLLYIFLFIIGYFVVWPLIKVALRIRSARNAWRHAMNGGGSGRREAPRRERPGGWSGAPARPKRKKIGRDVGEYVAFEEETVTASETSGSTSTAESASFAVEEQVEDAVWEDIK